MANQTQNIIQEEMATTSTAVTTVTREELSQNSQPPPVAVLKLRKPRLRKKVEWTNDTVDNENMNKKKSKCCCIYEKKRDFNESDSEDSGDECDNCAGHVEKKKHKQLPQTDPQKPLPPDIS